MRWSLLRNLRKFKGEHCINGSITFSQALPQRVDLLGPQRQGSCGLREGQMSVLQWTAPLADDGSYAGYMNSYPTATEQEPDLRRAGDQLLKVHRPGLVRIAAIGRAARAERPED